MSRQDSIAWALAQLFKTAPVEGIALFMLILLQGILPAASLFVIREVVDWISPGISNSSESLIVLVCIWGSILLVDVSIGPFISVIRIQLNEKIIAHCNILLMEKANSIQGIKPFEETALYDEIQFLREESGRRPLNFVYILTGFLRDFITLSSILIILVTMGWWVPVGVLLAAIPHAVSSWWFEKESWDQMLFRSPESRRMNWFSSLTMDDRASKEIRFFGFGKFLTEQYKRLASTYHKSLGQERWKKSLICISLSLVTVASNIAIFVFVVIKAKSGVVSVGSLVMTVQALVMTQLQLSGCIANIGMLKPTLLFFEKFKTFLKQNLCGLYQSLDPLNPSEHLSSKQIDFENVSFKYPDGRVALRNVTFSIKSEERVAIVGENGAGKSTIVKLLARFYDPSEGRITVDGVDIKELDIEAWRKSLSGVFQDFGQYQLSVKENISLSDLFAEHDEIAEASKKGGLHSVINKLPNGFDSKLGKEFGGTTLSGGEWQKLAMSRAFLRDANILILDEPTAALDPRSEYEVFQRFSQNSEGKTVILITHRLGSVKMADRLLVFKNGELVEEGKHSHLMALGGEYAQLFSLQAESYLVSNNLESVALH
ncbi:MAG: Vitamin B12 import ATP-binding protein BtuD [Chlamydiales bacterium]|nr:Vitamin B12 import ATP-binding protein BtuD [Chlamydiales bacterium]